MPEYPDAPGDEVSVSELMKELRKREVHNVAHSAKRKELDQATDEVVRLASKVEQLEKELEEARVARAQASTLQHELRGACDRTRVEVATLYDTDENDIRQQIAGADAINRKVRSNHEHAKRKQLLDEKQSESISLSAEIQDIDETKAKALSDAKFPIAGLSFAEGQPFAGDRRSAVTASPAHEAGVTYNNIPFNQCSSSRLG